MQRFVPPSPTPVRPRRSRPLGHQGLLGPIRDDDGARDGLFHVKHQPGPGGDAMRGCGPRGAASHRGDRRWQPGRERPRHVAVRIGKRSRTQGSTTEVRFERSTSWPPTPAARNWTTVPWTVGGSAVQTRRVRPGPLGATLPLLRSAVERGGRVTGPVVGRQPVTVIPRSATNVVRYQTGNRVHPVAGKMAPDAIRRQFRTAVGGTDPGRGGPGVPFGRCAARPTPVTVAVGSGRSPVPTSARSPVARRRGWRDTSPLSNPVGRATRTGMPRSGLPTIPRLVRSRRGP